MQEVFVIPITSLHLRQMFKSNVFYQRCVSKVIQGIFSLLIISIAVFSTDYAFADEVIEEPKRPIINTFEVYVSDSFFIEPVIPKQPVINTDHTSVAPVVSGTSYILTSISFMPLVPGTFTFAYLDTQATFLAYESDVGKINEFLIQANYDLINYVTISYDGVVVQEKYIDRGIGSGQVTSTSIALEWDVVDNAVGYTLYKLEFMQSDQQEVVVPGTSFLVKTSDTSFTDTGLNPDTTYFYIVESYTIDNVKNHRTLQVTTASADFDTWQAPTATPSLLTVVRNADDSITLNWDAWEDDGVVEFTSFIVEIESSTKHNRIILDDQIPTTVTSFTISTNHEHFDDVNNSDRIFVLAGDDFYNYILAAPVPDQVDPRTLQVPPVENVVENENIVEIASVINTDHTSVAPVVSGGSYILTSISFMPLVPGTFTFAYLDTQATFLAYESDVGEINEFLIQANYDLINYVTISYDGVVVQEKYIDHGIGSGQVTSTSIALEWDVVDNAVGYTLYKLEFMQSDQQKVVPGTSFLVKTSDTSFTDTGLNPDTTYFYIVESYTIDNVKNHRTLKVTTASADSDTWQAPTATPSLLTVVRNADDSITLNWDAWEDDGVVEFTSFIVEIESSTKHNRIILDDQIPTTVTSFTISTNHEHFDDVNNSDRIFVLTADGFYNYILAAPVPDQVDPRTLQVPPVLPAPSKPQTLVASANHNSVTLSWNESNDDTITGYKILCRTPATESSLKTCIENTETVSNSYTVDDLKSDTVYVFRVIALNESEESPRSNFVKLSTVSEPVPSNSVKPPTITSEPPSKPQNLEASANNNTVKLSWTDPQDSTIDGYNILCKERGTKDLAVCNTYTLSDDSPRDSFTIESLDDGKYVYRVVAFNEAGDSKRSNYVRVNIGQ